MPRRSSLVERARQRGREHVAFVEREFGQGRRDRGLSQQAIADALGLDRSYISRIERGLVGDLSIVTASELLATVGLDLSLRAYPAAGPLRDAGHSALLERLRVRLHPDLGWATEVPMPIAGDFRAWDAVITGRTWRCGAEAETRPRDMQALERRIALKQRDGDVDCVILLLLDSRHNRRLVREHADALAERFRVPGSQALERLAAGRTPGGNAIVLL